MNTDHDTVNRQIIHDFGNGLKLVTDARTNKAYKTVNGEVKEQIDIEHMLVPEYSEMVFNIDKSVNR